MTGGRPLRFLGGLLGVWVGLRVFALWPGEGPERVIAAAGYVSRSFLPAERGERLLSMAARPGSPAAATAVTAAVSAGSMTRFDTHQVQLALAALVRFGEPAVDREVARGPSQPPSQPPPLRPAALAGGSSASQGASGAAVDNWALSVWAIARDGQAGAQAGTGGQLGGSQTGARLTYALSSRFALAARVSTPLRGRGAEAALGFDWQPTPAPFHVIAEARTPQQGGPVRPAAFVIGGVDPVAVGAGFRLEAYGQAGAVARGGGFADGAVRVAAPVARPAGLRLDLGIGGWGGAQRGATRVDIGPTAALVLPVAGRAVRVTLDWRQRIAGRAAPGSGPALAIGGDF